MAKHLQSACISIDDASAEGRLREAASCIERGEGGVVFSGLVVLSGTSREVRCEVIDPAPGAHRCAEEFEVLKENAMRALKGSRLAALLPPRPWRWVVGAD